MTESNTLHRMTQRKVLDGLRTRAEAAEDLGVSLRTIERYIVKGALRARKLPNGRIYIEAGSIDQFLTGEPALAEDGVQR